VNRTGFPTGDEESDEEDGALKDGDGDEEELPPLEDPAAAAATVGDEKEELAPLGLKRSDKPHYDEPDEPAAAPEVQPSAPKPKQVQAKKKPASSNEKDLVPEEDLVRFEPSKSFTGARQGYFFGKGEEGMGYYRDVRQRRPTREKPAGADGEAEAEGEPAATAEEESGLATLEGSTEDGAPLIEEMDEEGEISAFIPAGFHSAKASSAQAPQRAPRSQRAQQYLDKSLLLNSHIAAKDTEQSHASKEPSLDCHQTMQNLLFLVGIPMGHEVAGLQLSFVNRRLTISFCTRLGSERWHRHHVRRTLCRGVDTRQWHAEPAKGNELLIVLRKTEQGERWPEVFDTSTEALAANREPVIVPVDDSPLIQSVEDLSGDTAVGVAADAFDSAELDIAVPAGTPAVLGPPAKDKAGTPAPFNASAASAAAQSASVMGQAVLLRTRLMYQLF